MLVNYVQNIELEEMKRESCKYKGNLLKLLNQREPMLVKMNYIKIPLP